MNNYVLFTTNSYLRKIDCVNFTLIHIEPKFNLFLGPKILSKSSLLFQLMRVHKQKLTHTTMRNSTLTSHQPMRGEHRTWCGFFGSERLNAPTAWPPVIQSKYVEFTQSKIVEEQLLKIAKKLSKPLVAKSTMNILLVWKSHVVRFKGNCLAISDKNTILIYDTAWQGLFKTNFHILTFK